MSISNVADPNNPSAPEKGSKANYGNEIKPFGILVGGIVFMVLFIVNILLLIVFWPNKMPDAKDNSEPIYIRHNWSMQLMDAAYLKQQEKFKVEKDSIKKPGTALTDSVKILSQNAVDKQDTIVTAQGKQTICKNKCKKKPWTIHFNTLLLVLVVLGGFLGNLIQIASSFTAFVGLRKFKRSWLMWYYMKPFIAAALALVVYFVFRGGLLSGPNDIYSINPYAIISMALLTGLFTEAVTDKLKRSLDMIFPGSERKDSAIEPLIKGISTTEVMRGKPTTILIFGENVEKFKNVTITLNDKANPYTLGDDLFSLSYNHAMDDPSTVVLLEIKEDKKVIVAYKLLVKEG